MILTPLKNSPLAFRGPSDALPPFANNYSVLLDGVDERIDIDSLISPLNNTTVGTWSIWVKPVDSTPTTSQALITFGDTDGTSWIRLFHLAAGPLRFELSNAGTVQWRKDATGIPFTSGAWAHVAVVQDGVSPYIIINGTLVTQSFGVSTDKTQWFNNITNGLIDNGRIGCQSINAGGESVFYDGNITKPLFINRALSLVQVQDIYNAGTPKDERGIANGVSCFEIDGDIVPTLRDFIGSNNGTYVNVEQADIELDAP